jgi:hypothetical protein
LTVSQKPSWLDPRSPELIAADILAALKGTPPDANLQTQLDYYQQHPRLRWR